MSERDNEKKRKSQGLSDWVDVHYKLTMRYHFSLNILEKIKRMITPTAGQDAGKVYKFKEYRMAKTILKKKNKV